MTDTDFPALARHRRTGAEVTLIGRSPLDAQVAHYRDAAGKEYAGFAQDYEVVVTVTDPEASHVLESAP